MNYRIHILWNAVAVYISSEHTAYSPVNLGYLCEAIYYEFINHVRGCRNALPKLTLHLLNSVWDYTKGRVKNLRFSHALHNVITYEIISFYKGTLVILIGLPVSTSWPSSVTSTMISHWADGSPSSVYTSQLFLSST